MLVHLVGKVQIILRSLVLKDLWKSGIRVCWHELEVRVTYLTIQPILIERIKYTQENDTYLKKIWDDVKARSLYNLKFINMALWDLVIEIMCQII